MSDVVIVQRGLDVEHRRVHDLLPAGARHGDLALGQHVEGFQLAEYESPPGAFPAAEFTSHMVGVAAAGPATCSLWWRGLGGIRTHTMHPGTVFTASPGPVDSLHWDGGLKMMTLSIEPATLEQVLPESSTGRSPELLPLRAGPIDRVLSHLLEAIRSEVEQGCPGGRLFIESLCHTTAVYLSQRYGAAPSPPPADRGGLRREVLSRVLDYIDCYLPSDLSITTLAGIACISPYHFARMFRQSTGSTVHRYVTQKRLARAQHLLRFSTLTLSGVAVATGFYDQSHMTSAFRRYTRMTPRAYRLQSRR